MTGADTIRELDAARRWWDIAPDDTPTAVQLAVYRRSQSESETERRAADDTRRRMTVYPATPARRAQLASAQTSDRRAILDRVAEGIWKASGVASPVCWAQAKIEEAHDTDPLLSEAVRLTKFEAAAAVRALVITSLDQPGALRICQAGEAVSGLSASDCAHAFNAMLSEILE